MRLGILDTAEDLDEHDGIECALLNARAGQCSTVLDVDWDDFRLGFKGGTARFDGGKQRWKKLFEGLNEVQARDLVWGFAVQHFILQQRQVKEKRQSFLQSILSAHPVDVVVLQRLPGPSAKFEGFARCVASNNVLLVVLAELVALGQHDGHATLENRVAPC